MRKTDLMVRRSTRLQMPNYASALFLRSILPRIIFRELLSRNFVIQCCDPYFVSYFEVQWKVPTERNSQDTSPASYFSVESHQHVPFRSSEGIFRCCAASMRLLSNPENSLRTMYNRFTRSTVLTRGSCGHIVPLQSL